MTEAIHHQPVPIDLSASRVHQVGQKQQRSAQQGEDRRYGAASQQTSHHSSSHRSAHSRATSPSSSAGEERSVSSPRHQDQVDISAEAKMLQQLSQRDREVRAHEAAHAAVGGQYAGAPSYTYQRGPDGKQYAVGGEVQISVSKVAGDPEATVEKMQQVRRAAMAPASPSSADRKIAARATQLETQARAEMTEEEIDSAQQIEEDESESIDANQSDPEDAGETVKLNANTTDSSFDETLTNPR